MEITSKHLRIYGTFLIIGGIVMQQIERRNPSEKKIFGLTPQNQRKLFLGAVLAGAALNLASFLKKK